MPHRVRTPQVQVSQRFLNAVRGVASRGRERARGGTSEVTGTVLGVVSLRRSCEPPFSDASSSSNVFASCGATVSHPAVHQPWSCTPSKVCSRRPHTHRVAMHGVAKPPWPTRRSGRALPTPRLPRLHASLPVATSLQADEPPMPRVGKVARDQEGLLRLGALNHLRPRLHRLGRIHIEGRECSPSNYTFRIRP